MFTQIRDWIAFIAELIICIYVVREFYYDANKDEVKKQRKTRTTKKTTQLPSGESIVEENTETTEKNEN